MPHRPRYSRAMEQAGIRHAAGPPSGGYKLTRLCLRIRSDITRTAEHFHRPPANASSGSISLSLFVRQNANFFACRPPGI
jgi:hypothetical protein